MGAYQYAELIDRLLNSCEYLDPRPRVSKVEIPEDNPNAFRWKEQFTFAGDKILKVKDVASFDSEGNMVERAFSYDFREVGAEHPIFRICNHERLRSVNEDCHVHVGSNVIKCFDDSVKTTFAYAIHCIKNYYQQKVQEWENGGVDESGI